MEQAEEHNEEEDLEEGEEDDDLELASRTKERKVDIPLLNTAGPIFVKVFFILSLLEPSSIVKP